MDKYRHREYKAGKTIEVIETYPSNNGYNLTRERYDKRTPPSMARYNEKMQVRKLTRLINTNFVNNDFFLTLHYTKADRPKPETAKKQLSVFLRRLKALYKRNGKELKYIKVSAYGSKGGIHHHIVINNIGIDINKITALWQYSKRTPDFTPLYDTGEYSALASYLIKQSKIGHNAETISGRRYSGSHNLKQPELIKDIYIPKIVWKELPTPKRNYIIDIDSIEAGVNELTGRPYLFYRMIKQPPDNYKTTRAENKRAIIEQWDRIAPLGCIVDKRKLTNGQ